MSDTSFPILTAPDLEATAAFYASLGFQETFRIPADGDPDFVTLERSGATIGIARADQPWGERVASVRDPAGFLVHLGLPTDLDAT